MEWSYGFPPNFWGYLLWSHVESTLGLNKSEIGYLQNLGICLGIHWEFFESSLEIFESFGIFLGMFWEFFGNSLGILWGNLWKVIWIWKELICLSSFWFLLRFCLNGEGREFRSLEVREASSLHFMAKYEPVSRFLLDPIAITYWINFRARKYEPVSIFLID